MNLGAKAVLKPPQSTRWRDFRRPADFAKRLECGAFTAALGWPTGIGPRVSHPQRLRKELHGERLWNIRRATGCGWDSRGPSLVGAVTFLSESRREM
jgi:hypothetical protein